MRLALLTLCAFTGVTLALDTPKTAPKPKDAPPKEAALKVAAAEKIAVIGASISAGFRIDGNLDSFGPSKIQLANVIEASLKVAHQPIENHAEAMAFLDPKGSMHSAFEAMRADKPTMIVALDYLFWFGYGQKKEDQRSVDLDAALLELGTFTCPILLGDLPDMTVAAQVPEPMLQKAMVPAADTLKKLNEKIGAFAKEHANVIVVPIADITAKVQSDAEVQVRNNKWPKGSIDKLLQADRLHTTLEGTCAVWVIALDTWLNAQKDVPAGAFELDVAKLVEKVKAPQDAAVPVGAPAGKPTKKPGEKKPKG